MQPEASAGPCPCGSGTLYAACCWRWHHGAQHLLAPSAVALMRSRYSAYVLGLGDYLLATWHPSTRPAQALQFNSSLRWLGLEIKHHHQAAPDSAVVEFVARSKLGGRAHRLHEVSRFVREAGQWFYMDGEQP